MFKFLCGKRFWVENLLYIWRISCVVERSDVFECDRFEYKVYIIKLDIG